MRDVLTLKGRQGAGAGSAYIAVSFAASGVLTYAFQSLSLHALGPAGYGPLALLWSATFLTVQVLWLGGTQTLGRYVAEREAQGQDWRPVIRSVRDRKSTRLNSSHANISYAVFCLKKNKKK